MGMSNPLLSHFYCAYYHFWTAILSKIGNRHQKLWKFPNEAMFISISDLVSQFTELPTSLSLTLDLERDIVAELTGLAPPPLGAPPLPPDLGACLFGAPGFGLTGFSAVPERSGTEPRVLSRSVFTVWAAAG